MKKRPLTAAQESVQVLVSGTDLTAQSVFGICQVQDVPVILFYDRQK
jgi:hypothetical protein